MDENLMAKIDATLKTPDKPIDFDQLIEDGYLVRKGKSYYVPDIHALPKSVRIQIKEMSQTENGLRVTFYKKRNQ